MSDTVKLVLWIAVAVVVIGIIVWLFVNAGRRREVEARRFEAGELRARVEERLPEVQGSADRASVTAAMAEDARAEAERTAAEAKQRAEEARRLEQQAEQHRTAAESARSEHAGLEREADRVDPDVRTDDDGYRLDDDGNRLPGQEDSPPDGDAGVAAAPGAAGTAGAGAATFASNQDDDDEDDLADAENPFAPTASTEESADEAPEPDDDSADAPEEASDGRYQEPAWEPSDPGAGHTHPAARDGATDGDPADEQDVADETERTEGTEGTDEGTRATPDAGAGYAEDEPGAAGAHSDDTVDGDPVDEQTHDEETDQQTPGTSPAGQEREAGTDEDHVDVPALDDRDDVVAEGGTPTGDPGDHRGQPWATTPGQRGPEESDEPADEGNDVDMAPHSHASDEVDSVDEPVGSASEEPRREEAGPASGAAEAAQPEGDATERADAATEVATEPAPTAADGDDTAYEDETAGGDDTAYGDGATDEHPDTAADADQQGQATTGPTGRRVSEFDEVVDGGFGLGSAAPIGDGAQPLGHAVKGTREGTTFLSPDDEGYDDNEPDVWFYNEDAARRAGFTKSGE